MALPFMVDHDGSARAVVQTQLIAAMDNLIAQKRIPMMGAIFIAPVSRSQEYDTVSGKYAEFVEAEILPRVEKEYGVTLTKDESREAVYGMPYEEWKAKHQKEASPAQKAALEQSHKH
jgi:enterochelin esterase-like enzyme